LKEQITELKIQREAEQNENIDLREKLEKFEHKLNCASDSTDRTNRTEIDDDEAESPGRATPIATAVAEAYPRPSLSQRFQNAFGIHPKTIVIGVTVAALTAGFLFGGPIVWGASLCLGVGFIAACALGPSTDHTGGEYSMAQQPKGYFEPSRYNQESQQAINEATRPIPSGRAARHRDDLDDNGQGMRQKRKNAAHHGGANQPNPTSPEGSNWRYQESDSSNGKAPQIATAWPVGDVRTT
jgi:hypothetical protein